MNTEFIQRAKHLFLAAADLPAAEREPFLARECGADAALIERVRQLLRHASEERGADPVAPAARRAGPTRAGTELGDFVLLEELGRGGMGVVWLAEQKSLQRRVALKLVRPSFATPELLRRLDREAAILGRLHHPGIASIYAVGSVDLGNEAVGGEQHYFAMELVLGVPLDEHCDQAGLDTSRRLELMARICDAVDHAHQEGVVHRDLKPDNILVTAAGDPKVLDFGIAQVTSSDVMTMSMRVWLSH